MKKQFNICFLLIILNLMAWNNTYSQPYKSIFGSQSTQWNEFTYSLSSWTCVLSSYSDTIMNTKTYKRITFSGNNCFTTGYNEIFLREDTLQGKAWVYDLYHNDERLIMDLSLNVGDTFRIYPNSTHYDTIAIVDSVYLENSLKKVRLNVNTIYPGNDKLTFIEGVGTNVGIDYQVNNYFLDNFGCTYMLCSYKNNQLFYKNSYVDTCYIEWDGIAENKAIMNRINVFPNPTNDILNIQLSLFSKGTIVIYNSIGQIAKAINIDKNNLSLDISSWNKGIYFIRLFDGKGNNSISKLIVQ